MNSTRPICAAAYPSRVWVLCCVITQGPACRTVAGCTSPLSSKSCVIPTFLPKIPVTFAISFAHLAQGFDLDIHACGQVEFHQRVDRLLRRLQNIEQTLVGANLELLARFLVHVRRTQHAILVLHGGQRNRARDLRASAPRRVDNLTRGLVQDAVVVRLKPDANSFFSNHVSLSNPSRFAGGKNWRLAA